MKAMEPISQIMTKNVASVQQDSNLFEVIDLIKKNKVRHIPVLEGSVVVGIISRTDVNRLTFGGLFEEQEEIDESILKMLTIPQVMTSNPKTVKGTDSIKEVAHILSKSEYHALPVEDEEHHVIGIVTTTDLLRYLLQNLN